MINKFGKNGDKQDFKGIFKQIILKLYLKKIKFEKQFVFSGRFNIIVLKNVAFKVLIQK